MMQRLAIGVGLVMSVAVACSGRSKSTDSTASTGGERSLPDGGEPSAASGGAGTANGGVAGGGSSGVSGGRAANTGGRSTGTGGDTSPSEGGAPSTGGQAATGGSTVEPGTGGGGNGGNAGASGDGGAPPGNECGCGPLEQCFDGSLCVARSVVVPLGFAIDATEVTRSQYAAWLAIREEDPFQTPQCRWNQDLEPDAACIAQASVCQGAACDAHPQPCVDFCDAAVYCREVGKQLCGGTNGGPTDRDGADSEWLLTCTANGKHDALSGEAFVSGQCNDQTANSRSTVPVGSKTACQSPEPGYSGIFDLIGNLREWEDNCDAMTGAADICHLRGGSFGISAAAPVCSETVYADRGSFAESVGFRCCEPNPGRKP
jgi:sulfatase modifying factor 1